MNISEFLASTSAHGLTRTRPGEPKRRLWVGICVGAYVSLFFWTSRLIWEYFSEDNVSSTINIEHYSSGYVAGGDYHADDVFPRPLLCVKTGSLEDWRRYDGLGVVVWKESYMILRPSLARPFRLQPVVFYQDYYHGFGMDSIYGLCHRFDQTSDYYSIFWNSDSNRSGVSNSSRSVSSLRLFIVFSLSPDSAVDVSQSFVIDPSMRIIKILIHDVERFSLLEGARYTGSYNSDTSRPLPAFYDVSHCLDDCFWREMNSEVGCAQDPELSRRYEAFHRQRITLLGDSAWRQQMERICEKNNRSRAVILPEHFVCDVGVRMYIGYNETIRCSETSKRCRKRCKRNNNKLKFRMTVENLTEEQLEAMQLSNYIHPNATCIWFANNNLEVTHFAQIPKMTLLDLAGLVGGYLGLLVGASVLTICEFLELGVDVFRFVQWGKRGKWMQGKG